MRGRNFVAPMNKMGLCIAKNSAEGVKITSLGRYFISESFDLGHLFFVHFLKWQLPNLTSKTFTQRDGFKIKPFVGCLHFINAVNGLWTEHGHIPIGVSKDEFSLFVPTLINYKNIRRHAIKLIEYRNGLKSQKDDKSKREFKDNFSKSFIKSFLKTNSSVEIEKLLSNLKDYGDNTIRYFRLTKYLYIRGGGFYIDLEPRRKIEIEQLLAVDSAAPLEFKNVDSYIEYLADLKKPELSWENNKILEKIVYQLKVEVQGYIRELKPKRGNIPTFAFQKIENFDKDKLKQYIENLRAYRNKLQNLELHFESQKEVRIQDCIKSFSNIYNTNKKKSIELERLSTIALFSLNDAIEIKPNYPVGDDNEPTFTAPANKADIECFYELFNAICEVTMLKDRSQWYNEGQPVMRHLRDFELKYTEKCVYCLFIAPRLHQDTIETFWMANKYGYKEKIQKIIPLPISQFVKLLEGLMKMKTLGLSFTHDKLLDLYKKILGLIQIVDNSEEWVEKIPDAISNWQKSILV